MLGFVPEFVLEYVLEFMLELVAELFNLPRQKFGDFPVLVGLDKGAYLFDMLVFIGKSLLDAAGRLLVIVGCIAWRTADRTAPHQVHRRSRLKSSFHASFRTKQFLRISSLAG